MSRIAWVGEHAVDGRVLFRIGRDGDVLVAEWPGLCELRSARSGEHFTFSASEGADKATVEKVRVGLAAALVRHLRGETSVHASAVERNGRALAFLGASGAGKSTLAAWMCHRRGWSLVADDIARIVVDADCVGVVPTEREHWLDAHSREALGVEGRGGDVEREKQAIASPAAASAPARLTALVSLAYGGSVDVTLTPLRGQRAMAALIPCLVRFVLDETDAHVAEMTRIEAILAKVSFLELRAPREVGALARIVDVLEGL